MGITGIVLSWLSREPVITAWSTPAAAFLVTALATTPYAEAIGAYLINPTPARAASGGRRRRWRRRFRRPR